jgi:hypothetical protein
VGDGGRAHLSHRARAASISNESAMQHQGVRRQHLGRTWECLGFFCILSTMRCSNSTAEELWSLKKILLAFLSKFDIIKSTTAPILKKLSKIFHFIASNFNFTEL